MGPGSAFLVPDPFIESSTKCHQHFFHIIRPCSLTLLTLAGDGCPSLAPTRHAQPAFRLTWHVRLALESPPSPPPQAVAQSESYTLPEQL